MKPLQRSALTVVSGLFMSTAVGSERCFFPLQHLKDFLNSFMFSGATLNLSLWIPAYHRDPTGRNLAGKSKEMPLACTDSEDMVHMCGRQCLAIAEAELSSAGTKRWTAQGLGLV